MTLIKDATMRPYAATTLLLTVVLVLSSCPARDPCVEAVGHSMAEIDRDPTSAESEFRKLREVFASAPNTDAGAGSILEGMPDDAEARVEWIGFVCFLADSGNERARRLIENTIYVQDGSAAMEPLMQWLDVPKNGSLDGEYAKQKSRFTLRKEENKLVLVL